MIPNKFNKSPGQSPKSSEHSSVFSFESNQSTVESNQQNLRSQSLHGSVNSELSKNTKKKKKILAKVVDSIPKIPPIFSKSSSSKSNQSNLEASGNSSGTQMLRRPRTQRQILFEKTEKRFCVMSNDINKLKDSLNKDQLVIYERLSAQLRSVHLMKLKTKFDAMNKNKVNEFGYLVPEHTRFQKFGVEFSEYELEQFKAIKFDKNRFLFFQDRTNPFTRRQIILNLGGPKIQDSGPSCLNQENVTLCIFIHPYLVDKHTRMHLIKHAFEDIFKISCGQKFKIKSLSNCEKNEMASRLELVCINPRHYSCGANEEKRKFKFNLPFKKSNLESNKNDRTKIDDAFANYNKSNIVEEQDIEDQDNEDIEEPFQTQYIIRVGEQSIEERLKRNFAPFKVKNKKSLSLKSAANFMKKKFLRNEPSKSQVKYILSSVPQEEFYRRQNYPSNMAVGSPNQGSPINPNTVQSQQNYPPNVPVRSPINPNTMQSQQNYPPSAPPKKNFNN